MRRASRTSTALSVLLLAYASRGVSVGADDQPRTPSPASPHLQIESDTINLGEVLRGTEAQASFVVRNTGGDTLRILEAKPG